MAPKNVFSNSEHSPSGHLYEREVILEYLLHKTKELKAQARAYEQEQVRCMLLCRCLPLPTFDQLRLAAEAQERSTQSEQAFLDTFAANEEGVSTTVKRKLTAAEDRNTYMESRKKHIDDTDRETRMKDLQVVCPWIPQFTPQAEDTKMKKPPKRPTSPMTSRPLRTSDLVPLTLLRDDGSSGTESGGGVGSVKFICSVSR